MSGAVFVRCYHSGFVFLERTATSYFIINFPAISSNHTISLLFRLWLPSIGRLWIRNTNACVKSDRPVILSLNHDPLVYLGSRELFRMTTTTPEGSKSFEYWQTSKTTVRERTTFLFNNSLMSDIKFVVGESDSCRQVCVPAHKFVLAISSPVFEAMFYGQMAEKGEEVELPDTDSHTLLEFLRFVYCDEVNLTADNVRAVLYLADKYDVPPLKKKCVRFLEDTIDTESVFDILMMAQKINEEDLRRICWEMIDLFTGECLEAMNNLDESLLGLLLKRDTLTIDEVALFGAVLRWAKEKCESQNLGVTGPEVRRVLGENIFQIRFLTMLLDQFNQEVVPTGVLTDEEIMSVRNVDSLKFLSVARKGKPLTRAPLLNYDSPYKLQRRTEKVEEQVSFNSNRSIYLAGVRLFTGRAVTQGDHKRSATVSLSIEGQQKGWASETGLFSSNRDESTFLGFDVLFPRAVLVKANVDYKLAISISSETGKKTVTNLSGTNHNVVRKESVEFTFSHTSVKQISELLFYLPSP